MINFIDKLEKIIASAIWNNYKDNHDHYRFGPVIENPAESKFRWASNAVKLILKGSASNYCRIDIGPLFGATKQVLSASGRQPGA
jgi:hypothetical protein